MAGSCTCGSIKYSNEQAPLIDELKAKLDAIK
jgi:hypothetical protein